MPISLVLSRSLSVEYLRSRRCRWMEARVKLFQVIGSCDKQRDTINASLIEEETPISKAANTNKDGVD